MKITQPDRAAMRAAPSRAAFALACAAAVCTVLFAYANSLDNAFHFDDAHVIEENLFIRDLGNAGRFFTDARTFSSVPTNATYRPIVSLSLALDHWRGRGLEPRAFHETQILMLIVIGVMLVFVFHDALQRTLASRGNRWLALIAATWFCVHTGNTQPVNYVSARSELLAGIGILGALLLYARAPRARRFQLHLVPLAFGALAKTPAVIAAPLLLAYALLIEQRLALPELFSRRAWPRVRAGLLATAPAFVAAIGLYVFVEGMNPNGQTYGGGGRLEYLVTQTWVWAHYARLFVLPNALTADTDLELFPSPWDPRVAMGVLFTLVMAALAWRASRRAATRVIAFGIAWFAIGLVPSSTVLPLAEVANDHRMFFPFMGLALATVGGLGRGVEAIARGGNARWAPAVGVVLAVAVIAAHVGATRARNRDWRTEETLWADVVRKSPANGRGWMNYGLTQLAEGRDARARELFLEARARLPNYATLEVNLGIVEGRLGRHAAADSHFVRALELNPAHPAPHRYYARWLVERGRAAEAEIHLERTVALSPADLTARHRLLELRAARGAAELAPLALETLGFMPSDSIARAYARGSTPVVDDAVDAEARYRRGLELTGEERHAEAAQAYRAALALDPAHADAWNNLGWSLGKLGFFAEAASAFREALRLAPGDRLVANNLAWAERSVADAAYGRAVALQRTGRAAEAVAVYRALVAEHPAWVNARYNLGMALMELDRHAEAGAEFRRTLELRPQMEEARRHLAICIAALEPGEAARLRTRLEPASTRGGAPVPTKRRAENE